MKLTHNDINSDLWVRLSKHVEKRLSDLRAENDNDKDAEKTAKLRGRIYELKQFLALAEREPAPEPEVSDGE